jgi:hypothetical protein
LTINSLERNSSHRRAVNGKKERSRKLNKTVEINAADILSNIATKISHAIATNYPQNASVATTASKTSENRK